MSVSRLLFHDRFLFFLPHHFAIWPYKHGKKSCDLLEKAVAVDLHSAIAY